MCVRGGVNVHDGRCINTGGGARDTPRRGVHDKTGGVTGVT